MIRLLLLGLAIYIAARVLGGLIKPSKPPVEVRGKSKKQPLDINREDVEDVDFKEKKD